MSRYFANIGIVTLLVLTGECTFAATQSLQDSQLSHMRQQFVLAERALKKGQRTRFKKIQSKLKQYPLYPYLEFAELKRRLKKARPEEIRGFIKRHEQTPLASKLRFRWLKTLARQKRWKLFAENYQATTDTRLRCAYSQALYATRQSKRAHLLTESLWLTGRSLPRSCDAPLKIWKQAGKLTPDLLWKRIHLAMLAGKTRLARYLGKQLDEKEKFWLPLWLKVRRKPELVTQVQQRFAEQQPQVLRWIIADTLPRLARKQSEKALSLWESYSRQYSFTPREVMRIERSLLRYAYNTKTANRAFFNKTSYRHLKKQLQSDQIFSAIAEHDWSTALNQLEQLAPKTQHEARWIYWRGRILEAIGRLAGGVAHDFNNVLGAILANVSLLESRLEDRDSRRYLDQIESSVKSASRLTAQLLSFSRGELNRAEPLDLNQVVEDTLAILERAIDPRIRV